MPLSVGDKLGPYEILALIGAGGMGEVYKARDPRLDRIVAIKVSKTEFSERFEREAKAIAALNHPHICQIYDVGPNYLVMEYIEGVPLKGPLPLDRALEYAGQIAGALDAAHSKKITHRDLKPANILVTKQGVKLLDFGLATVEKPVAMEQKTATIGLTAKGQILGTLRYMSPEQVNGKEADPRSDIFSFGVVLYEMLTGKRAFEGSTPASVIAAILERPALSVSSVAPPSLDRILGRCLEKHSENRWQTARDLKAALEWVGQPDPAVPKIPTRLRLLPWAVATLLAVVAVTALWAPWRAPSSATQNALRVDLDLGAPLSLRNIGTDAVLSPDGSRLVFVSVAADGSPRLFTRLLDQAKVLELAGTSGAMTPFFSPDGQSVGFFARGKLKKTRLDGGEPIALVDAPAARGGTWGEDGKIIAALDNRAGLMLIPVDGGPAEQLTPVRPEDNSVRWPQILPGGRAVLFTANNVPSNFDEATIEVVTLADRRRKIVLAHAGMYPRYLPSGHLIYVTKGALFAVPFNLEKLEAQGKPFPVLEEVINDPNYGSAQLDFAKSGALIYRKGLTAGLATLQWLEASGKTEPIANDQAGFQFPLVSPDGSRIAAIISSGSNSVLWIFDVLRGSRTRLTVGAGVNTHPVWSSDGSYLVFQAAGGMFWTRSDGAGPPQLLTKSSAVQWPSSFTPDGTRLAYSELNPQGGSFIRTVVITGKRDRPVAGAPEPFLSCTGTNSFPRFSPDGRWIAYADAESGIYDVYVRSFPDNGTKWQVSTKGGAFPVWSPNGRELFYRDEDSRIMVMNYTVQNKTFVPEKPRLWSPKQLNNNGLTPNLDIAPDGKRFAVLLPAESQEPLESRSHVTLVVNFFDELRRRAEAR